MPNVGWNVAVWSGTYDWSQRGEEWSAVWGSSSAQWFASILPRIRSFVPNTNVLEIAPGFGRWTRFLGSMCTRYYGVDISTECVDHCRKSFPKSHMEFFATDGTTLSMIPDGSIDLAFSFDSLVHADAVVIETYIRELLSKLSPKGAAFIHHSNLAELDPPRDDTHMRDPTVSSALFREYVSARGGQMLYQEIIDWGGRNSIDCLSLFCRLGAYNTAPKIAKNNKFMEEARYIGANIAPWEFR